MRLNMKTLLKAGIALSLMSGVAVAQTTYSTTTTEAPAVVVAPAPAPVVVAPPSGVLSTTRTTRATDAYGNQVNSQSTTYRNTNGVAQDSTTTTRTAAPPPPPPAMATTTTTETTTTHN
jgi:hypothetical protein